MSPAPDGPAGARRLYRPQWALALAALEAAFAGRAVDRYLQAAFREQRQMGARDRGHVGGLVYGALRDLRRLQRIAGSARPQDLLAVLALERELAAVPALQSWGVDTAAELAARLADFDAGTLTEPEALNVPEPVWVAWCAQWGAADARALGAALQQQAPVDLRVNTLKVSRAQALEALAQAGVEAHPTPLAPIGLRLAGRAPATLAPLRQGWLEPQDEGSQLLALLVAAQPGERIADWCAGAGGKTLALAAALQGQGELVALDLEAVRLQRLTARLLRAGADDVRLQPLAADGSAPPELGLFDAVLVDAPCSGTGTWRRQPEARLKLPDPDALARLQFGILRRAADHVRPGGRLVYGTCSLLSAENEAVVERFCAEHPAFAVEDAGAVLARAGVDLPGRYLALRPDRHGTDGFFGAVLVRNAR